MGWVKFGMVLNFPLALGCVLDHECDRSTMLYTVLRATPKSSAISALVCWPPWWRVTRRFFLGGGELGLLAAELALVLGDLHAFAGAGADEIGFEFGDHGQDVEEEFSDGVGGVVDGSAEARAVA